MTSAVTTTPTTPPPDTRRITEHDPALKRLKARTERALSASIQQLVADLRRGEPVGQAQSHFIQRHLVILRNAYEEAHREGQRDYYQGVSRTPQKWAEGEPDHMTLQRRMLFYAPSVAKMAHEAARAYEAPPSAADNAVTLDESGVQQWQQSLGARITLQADLTWSGGQDGYVQAGWADSAVNPYGALWWSLEPRAQHCSDCPSLAAGSPYDPPWVDGGNPLMTTPGDGATECGAGCRCSLSYGPGRQVGSYAPMAGTPAEIVPPSAATAGTGADEEQVPFVVTPANGEPAFTVARRQQFIPPTAEEIAALPEVARPVHDLNEGEQRAMDSYRQAVAMWNYYRAALPPLPMFWQMLARSADDPPLWDWDTLTGGQKRALRLLQKAISQWYASSPDVDLYDGNDF